MRMRLACKNENIRKGLKAFILRMIKMEHHCAASRLEAEFPPICLPQHSSECVSLPIFLSLFTAISNKRWLIWQVPWWLAAQWQYHTLGGRLRRALLSYSDVLKWGSLSKHARRRLLLLIETQCDCLGPNALMSHRSPASCLCHIWLSLINAVPAM